MTVAYIGVGANLGDREGNIRRALELLGGAPGTRVLRTSSIFETDPVDMEEPEPRRFLNAAAEIETELGTGELLAVLKRIEGQLGREPGGVRTAVGGAPRYRSRTIDLDILLYGDQVVREGDLAIPHPRMGERSFVLEPLAELCPDQVVPGTGSTVRGLLGRLRARTAGQGGASPLPSGRTS